MTSEKELRQVAAQLLRNTLRDGPFGVDYRKITPYKQYDLDDKDRIRELHRSWPIPDLPPGDRDGYWWPKHGRNYGNVHGHVPLNGNGELRHGEWEVVIGRGSGYIHLTPAEAEELASLLLAAARHERNQN